MLDAARGASARRITAVIPYYSYARSDKKDAPRISIAGRLVADLMATAGADRVLVMTRRPATVVADIKIPFGRPRDMAVSSRAEFTEICDHLRGLIEHKRTPWKQRGAKAA